MAPRVARQLHPARCALWLTIVLAVLLVVPGATASWAVPRGDAARSGTADATLDLYDVLDVGEIPAPAVGLSRTGVVATPEGDLWVHQVPGGNGPCRLLVGAADGPRVVATIEPCVRPNLLGYSSLHDHALVCTNGGAGDDVLRAVELATGTTAWSVRPSDLDATAQGRLGIAAQEWNCRGGALDPTSGHWFVPFSSDHVASSAPAYLLKLDGATGQTLRRASFVAAAQGGTGNGQLTDLVRSPPAVHDAVFRPEGVTLSASGVIVTGTTLDETAADLTRLADADNARRAVHWFDRALEGRASYAAAADGDAARSGSAYATADDTHAFLVLGTELVVIDAQRPSPVATVELHTAPGAGGSHVHAAPAIDAQRVFVPVADQLVAYDAGTQEVLWTHTFGVGHVVDALVVGANGDLLVAVDAHGDDARLVHLGSNGALQNDVPLPFGRPDAATDSVIAGRASAFLSLLPRTDGSLQVLGAEGARATLGAAPASERPTMALSDVRILKGNSVSLRADSTDVGPLDRILIDWGDGTQGRLRSDGGSIEHRYPDPGGYTLRAQAIYNDGTTRTATTPLQVAATAEAMSPTDPIGAVVDDLPWLLLGVVVVAGLAAWLLRGTRAHRQLRALLRRADGLMKDGTLDVASTVRGLVEVRTEALQMASDGRLDSAQYRVVVDAIQGHVGRLREETLGPYLDKVSERYLRVLSRSMQDGLLKPRESKTLRSALMRERRLGAEDRASLDAMLMAWTDGEPSN